MPLALLTVVFLIGFVPVAALVCVLFLRRVQWQRVLVAAAPTVIIPLGVMMFIWMPNSPFKGWAPLKTLGNLSEFAWYGVASGLALVGLRVAGRTPSRWRLLGVQGHFIAAAVLASVVIWQSTDTVPEPSLKWQRAACVFPSAAPTK